VDFQKQKARVPNKNPPKARFGECSSRFIDRGNQPEWPILAKGTVTLLSGLKTESSEISLRVSGVCMKM
jgi:hypothetical protein